MSPAQYVAGSLPLDIHSRKRLAFVALPFSLCQCLCLSLCLPLCLPLSVSAATAVSVPVPFSVSVPVSVSASFHSACKAFGKETYWGDQVLSGESLRFKRQFPEDETRPAALGFPDRCSLFVSLRVRACVRARACVTCSITRSITRLLIRSLSRSHCRHEKDRAEADRRPWHKRG